jgi:hypothetical protein
MAAAVSTTRPLGDAAILDSKFFHQIQDDSYGITFEKIALPKPYKLLLAARRRRFLESLTG